MHVVAAGLLARMCAGRLCACGRNRSPSSTGSRWVVRLWLQQVSLHGWVHGVRICVPSAGLLAVPGTDGLCACGLAGLLAGRVGDICPRLWLHRVASWGRSQMRGVPLVAVGLVAVPATEWLCACGLAGLLARFAHARGLI